MTKGKLYLVPCYLSEDNSPEFIADEVKDIIKKTSHFAVENVRSARRFISSLSIGIDISSLSFSVLDKNFNPLDCKSLFEPVYNGHDLGIISEAGLPAIADPGNVVVSYAHENDIEVVALPGASSILMGLISSGFNGQQFVFHGYLPIDSGRRKKKIHQMEKEAIQTGYTQIFMETPYRNVQLMESLLGHLHPDTKLFAGINLSGRNKMAKTMKIKDWKLQTPKNHKIPTVYAIGI